MSAEVYALGDNAYCSPEDVQGAGGEFSWPAAYSEAEQKEVILRASKMIDKVTGGHFGYSTITLVLDGSGRALLRTSSLLSWRIVDIIAIHYREDYGDAWDTQIDSSDFTVAPSRRAIKRIDNIWIAGTKNYRVQAHFGRKYVPQPIKWAAVLLARNEVVPGSAAKYEQVQSESFGDGYSYTRKSVATTPVSVSVSTGVPQVDVLLSGYVNEKPLFSVPGS